MLTLVLSTSAIVRGVHLNPKEVSGKSLVPSFSVTAEVTQYGLGEWPRFRLLGKVEAQQICGKGVVDLITRHLHSWLGFSSHEIDDDRCGYDATSESVHARLLSLTKSYCEVAFVVAGLFVFHP